MPNLETTLTQSAQGFYPLEGPKISNDALESGHPWPHPARWIVRCYEQGSDYFVDVEINVDDDGAYVSGVAARLAVPTSSAGSVEDPWLEGAPIPRAVARDIQQLPLATYMAAALARVGDPFGIDRARPSAPSRGRGAAFYQEVLETAHALEEQGERPVPEIARRWEVSENLASQWLSRARRLHGEAPPRKGGRRMTRKRK